LQNKLLLLTDVFVLTSSCHPASLFNLFLPCGKKKYARYFMKREFVIYYFFFSVQFSPKMAIIF